MNKTEKPKNTYSFDDWLNDKIDFKLPGGIPIIKSSNGLRTLCYKFELIPEKDFNKIEECQKKAFDIAVELSVKGFISVFQDSSLKSINSKKLYDLEVERINDLLNEDKNLFIQVLSGAKTFSTFQGSQYKKILNDNEKINNEEIQISVHAINDNQRLTALYKYKEWLRKNNPNKRKQPPREDSSLFESRIKKALSRLKLFKQENPEGKQMCSDDNFKVIYDLTEKFIRVGEYDPPSNRIRVLIDHNVIRLLFFRINSDLYPRNRKTRNFMKFIKDVFHLPYTWDMNYINRHFSDKLKSDGLSIKYQQFLET